MPFLFGARQTKQKQQTTQTKQPNNKPEAKNMTLKEKIIARVKEKNPERLEMLLVNYKPIEIYNAINETGPCPLGVCFSSIDGYKYFVKLFEAIKPVGAQKILKLLNSPYSNGSTVFTRAASNYSKEYFDFLMRLDQDGYLSAEHMASYLVETLHNRAGDSTLFVVANNPWQAGQLLQKTWQLSLKTLRDLLLTQSTVHGDILGYAKQKKLAALNLIASYYFYFEPERALAHTPHIQLLPALCLSQAWEFRLRLDSLAQMTDPILQHNLARLLIAKIQKLEISQGPAATRSLFRCINALVTLGGHSLNVISWNKFKTYLSAKSRIFSRNQAIELAIRYVRDCTDPKTIQHALMYIAKQLQAPGSESKLEQMPIGYIHDVISLCRTEQVALQRLQSTPQLAPHTLKDYQSLTFRAKQVNTPQKLEQKTTAITMPVLNLDAPGIERMPTQSLDSFLVDETNEAAPLLSSLQPGL